MPLSPAANNISSIVVDIEGTQHRTSTTQRLQNQVVIITNYILDTRKLIHTSDK